MSMMTEVPRARRGWQWPLTGLALAMLAGCFSGSGSSSSSGDRTLQGVFVDSPVAGLGYLVDGKAQRTDDDGRFRYQSGQTLTFSLGGLELGSATGAEVLTPVDLVDGGDLADDRVINLARLLQSLDGDGNLGNGIQISEAMDAAIADYVAANSDAELDLADTERFESFMQGVLATLNEQGLFAENAADRQRSLRSRLHAWQHLNDSLAQLDGVELKTDVLPVLFVHGGAGSASQFESQAQRFRANGYPASHIATLEYDSGIVSAALTQSPPDLSVLVALSREINAAIDELQFATGAQQVNLLGHSLGTAVSQAFLSNPANAARVAHYVNIDGRSAAALPGGVPTLALWGQYVTESVAGAENVYPPEDDPMAHIEAATSAESFSRIYRFFNGEDPVTNSVPDASADQVWVAGRANLFPQNLGAEGARLEIYEVDPVTGVRLGDSPLYVRDIDDSGDFGPFAVSRGASIEYVLMQGESNAQYFYREPYHQDSLLVRLNTSRPGEGVGNRLHRSANHTNLMIGRDMEFWGDQGDNNDSLQVNGTELVSELTAPLLKRLSVLFLHDRDSDGMSNLDALDPDFAELPFMSGLDLYVPASAQGSNTIEVRLQSRRGGPEQVISVPNWPSDEVRSVSVQFRDYTRAD